MKSRLLDEGRELNNINACYALLDTWKKTLTNNQNLDWQNVRRELDDIIDFTKAYQARLSSEAKSAQLGFYSSSHALVNVLSMFKQLSSNFRVENKEKMITCLDEAMRLMAHPVQSVKKEINHLGRLSVQEFTLQYLVEIPENWKQAPEGRDFVQYLSGFISRRVKKIPLDNNDSEVLEKMSRLVSKAYEGAKFDDRKASNAPLARELLLVHLALLSDKVKINKGTAVISWNEIAELVKLIQGIFYYKETADLAQQLRPGVQYDGLPAIVEVSEMLRT